MEFIRPCSHAAVKGASVRGARNLYEMLHDRKRVVKRVQQPAPLLIFGAAAKADGVGFQRVPPHQQHIPLGIFQAALQLVAPVARLAGNQRPGGRLYPQDDSRMVLLGAMRLSGEQGAFGYGRDSERDLAGFLERIGQRRWRVILPGPSWEALFRVIEIVPAA